MGYINQQTLLNALERKQCGPANRKYTEGYNDCLMRVRSMVSTAPVADVAPVVHGTWIRPHWRNDNYCCDCSECGGEAIHRDYQWHKNGAYPICPNCGAKMDGGTK